MTPSAPLPTSQTTEASESPLIRIRSLRKSFGKKEVLRDISFEVPKGGIVSILGRSGTGKSVLLRCVVGLHQPDQGEILYAGKNVAEPAHREALRRASSYVFQQNALFDSATVLENMLLPLQCRADLAPAEQLRKAQELLSHMELEEASGRFPAQLSGGMQKRLAVARALITDPEIVFFDEPTAGLDPIRRNAVFEMIVR
jgi:phospholipid/cholesterol/gamma-HCH transport system ATP-binding protein